MAMRPSGAMAVGTSAGGTSRPRDRRSLRTKRDIRSGDVGDVLVREIMGEQAAELDAFDAVQLAHVIATCRASRTLAEAGRKLFAVSRTRRSVPNDSDRLRKYLGSYGLTWDQVARA